MKKKIIIEKSELPITSKSGLYLLDFLLDQIDFNRNANRIFGAPGSNRGFAASVYLRTIIHMIADGALALDDVKEFQDDEGYKRLLADPTIPSSDALGDGLYRQCQIIYTNKEEAKKEDEKDKVTKNPGEEKIMALIGEHARLSITKEQRSCLDVDATIYVNDKSDAAWT